MTAFEVVEHDALDSTTGAGVKVERVVEKAPIQIAGVDGPWQIKVSLDGDPQDWLNAVAKACSVALEMTTTTDDVMQIFKKNKKIFDAVKAQDQEFFKDLMIMFTETKNKLTKE
jgi:2C-methyl-D-erythritol 2,4-cyclodiphosphate synthase